MLYGIFNKRSAVLSSSKTADLTVPASVPQAPHRCGRSNRPQLLPGDWRRAGAIVLVAALAEGGGGGVERRVPLVGRFNVARIVSRQRL